MSEIPGIRNESIPERAVHWISAARRKSSTGIITEILESRIDASNATGTPPCRLIALAPIAASGTQTVDGLATVPGNRILRNGESDQTLNGIFIAGAGDWDRAEDTLDPAASGAVLITEGSADNAGSLWRITNTSRPVFGTDDIAFARVYADVYDAWITPTKIATSIAGAGLSGGAGSPLAVNVDGSRVTIVSDQITTPDNQSAQKIIISKAGTVIGTRHQFNLIEGSGMTLTAVDNSGADRVDVTIAASGSSGDIRVRAVVTGYDFTGNAEVPNGIPSSSVTDGVTVTAGQKLLILGETDQTYNDIWMVAAGNWTRATDVVKAGSQIQVMFGGTTAGGGVYYCRNTTDPVRGVDNVNFVRIQAVPLDGSVSTLKIIDAAVTNAKLANMAQATIKGRAAGAGAGAPADLTATQATAILNPFTGDAGSGGLKGLVPAPAAGDAPKFLKGDGTWGAISAGTVTSIDVSGGSSGLTFANGPVTISGTITLSGGQLSVPYGGTGRGSLDSGAIILGNGTSAVGFLGPDAAGKIPISNGSGFGMQAVGGDATITAGGTVTVTRVQSTPFHTTPPTNGQVPMYVSANSRVEWAAPSGGATVSGTTNKYAFLSAANTLSTGRAEDGNAAAYVYIPWGTGDTKTTFYAGAQNGSNSRIAIHGESGTNSAGKFVNNSNALPTVYAENGGAAVVVEAVGSGGIKAEKLTITTGATTGLPLICSNGATGMLAYSTLALAGDVSGAHNATTVAKFQGRAFASTTPSTNQFIGWDGSTWKPMAVVLTLPYADSYTSAGTDAFQITVAGSGGAAIVGLSTGTGKAALFQVNNAGGSNAARAESNSTSAETLYVLMTSTGSKGAILAETNNAAQTGPAIRGKTIGPGHAIEGETNDTAATGGAAGHFKQVTGAGGPGIYCEGSLRLARRANITAAVTLTTADLYCPITAAAANYNVALPTAANFSGRVLIIKDEAGALGGGAARTVTLVGTIDGAVNKAMNTARAVVRLISDGTNWQTW